jgi:hypothetical protein
MNAISRGSSRPVKAMHLLPAVLLPIAGCSLGADPVPLVDCEPRCEAKAASCGAPKDLAAPYCADFCGHDLTEVQAECILATSCGALKKFLAGDDVPGKDGCERLCCLGEDLL